MGFYSTQSWIIEEGEGEEVLEVTLYSFYQTLMCLGITGSLVKMQWSCISGSEDWGSEPAFLNKLQSGLEAAGLPPMFYLFIFFII